MNEIWKEKLIQYRRLFHRFPESGWNTFFATMFLADKLEQAGYEVLVGREILGDEVLMDAPDTDEIRQAEQEAIAYAQTHSIPRIDVWMERMGHRTGVAAVFETNRPGKTRAFRFDMDALPIAESTDAQRKPVQEGFLSQNPGVFHACGHDGHMALGIALAEALGEQKESLCGRFLFLFQPAEEGVRGAVAFRNRWNFGTVDELYCCHIGFAPEDTFVAGARGFLATTKFDVTFHGKSAHAGAAPERGRNALLAAARAVVEMQEFPRPETGIVRLNVGQLTAGESRNTIPALAKMQVETRGETGELNVYMKDQALVCVQRAAELYGVTWEVEFQGESVSASSDESLADEICELAREQQGFANYLQTWDFGASDDAAVLMDLVQRQGGRAAYLLFGARLTGRHHEAGFDFAEEVLWKAFPILLAAAQKDHE